ncbi:MAG: formylglycine-generating enzyme family protein [Acidobacteria bacterium]|nr:formylglycine-generating enzyme family protein [Acidobacteriota bacterium]
MTGEGPSDGGCPLPRHVLYWREAGVEMAFRLIPPGEFRMGTRKARWPFEEPAHSVTISQPFWLGETPVTQEQFDIWKREEEVNHHHDFNGRLKNPAERLSWQYAIRYCSWLERGKRDELPPDFPFVCVPTEAEWEYACRAGGDTAYHTGDGEDDLADAGWYYRDANDTTHPVGKKAANRFGLHDMHGNVWEWCHDVWDAEAYLRREDGVRDPGSLERLEEWKAGLSKMLESSSLRVRRGGSWGAGAAAYCRSAFRFGVGPVGRVANAGFRVCLARGPAAWRGAPGTAGAEVEW